MQITPEEFMKLCAPMSEKDMEIVTLRKELEQFRVQTGGTCEMKDDANFITLKIENVCKVLSELKGSPNLVSFLFLGLLKMMPKDISSAVVQRILASASLESIPLNLTALGDIRIDGNYNNIHDNDSVNL